MLPCIKDVNPGLLLISWHFCSPINTATITPSTCCPFNNLSTHRMVVGFGAKWRSRLPIDFHLSLLIIKSNYLTLEAGWEKQISYRDLEPMYNLPDKNSSNTNSTRVDIGSGPGIEWHTRQCRRWPTSSLFWPKLVISPKYDTWSLSQFVTHRKCAGFSSLDPGPCIFNLVLRRSDSSMITPTWRRSYFWYNWRGPTTDQFFSQWNLTQPISAHVDIVNRPAWSTWVKYWMFSLRA